MLKVVVFGPLPPTRYEWWLPGGPRAELGAHRAS